MRPPTAKTASSFCTCRRQLRTRSNNSPHAVIRNRKRRPQHRGQNRNTKEIHFTSLQIRRRMVRAPPPVRLALANAEKRKEKKNPIAGAGLAPHLHRPPRQNPRRSARGAAGSLRSELGKLPAAVASARSDPRETRRRIRRATRAQVAAARHWLGSIRRRPCWCVS
jgi:hypothetical protein